MFKGWPTIYKIFSSEQVKILGVNQNLLIKVFIKILLCPPIPTESVSESEQLCHHCSLAERKPSYIVGSDQAVGRHHLKVSCGSATHKKPFGDLKYLEYYIMIMGWNIHIVAYLDAGLA